jgi:hypothetical protein
MSVIERSKIRGLVRLGGAALLAVSLLTVSPLAARLQVAPEDAPGETPGEMPGEIPGEMQGGEPGEMPAEASTEETADRPTTRPHGWRNERGDRSRFGTMRPPGDRYNDHKVPEQEEWEEVVAFLRENSPTRLELYMKAEREFGDKRPQYVDGIRRRIAGRYRELNGVRDRAPDMYQFALRQLQLEDQIMESLITLRRDGETPEVVGQLNQQLRDFVENVHNERQTRLNKIREFITREEAELAADRDQIQERIISQRGRFESEMRRLIEFRLELDESPDRPNAKRNQKPNPDAKEQPTNKVPEKPSEKTSEKPAE